MTDIDAEFFIPTLNSDRTLETLLIQIKKQSDRITIFDGFSVDRTLDIAQKYGCKIIKTSTNIGAVRTMMIRTATSKYIAMIDADMQIPRNWLVKCHEWLVRLQEKDKTAVAVYGNDVPKYGKDREFYISAEVYKRLPLKNMKRLDTCNVFIERHAVRNFNCDAPAMEDYLLGKFIEHNGYSHYEIPVFAVHDNYETEEKIQRSLYLETKTRQIYCGLTFPMLFLALLHSSVIRAKPGFKIWILRRYLHCCVYYFQSVDSSDIRFYGRTAIDLNRRIRM